MKPVSDHAVAPVCPKCGRLMTAAERESRVTAGIVGGASGEGPRTMVAVWQCQRCGLDRPRW